MIGRILAAGIATTLAGTLVGCGYKGAQSLPLPGAIGGSDTYTITVILPDATNLVPKETCRTNDTVVGSVESISLDDNLQARVVCRIKDSVEIPANARGTLRETSLLGERFVALDPPIGHSPRGRLLPGTVIPASRTRVDPDVEVVFGALSQLLNGGSLGKLETITTELNTAMANSDLSGTIDELRTVMGEFADNREDITASLQAMDRFAGELAQQRDVVGDALDSVPDGLAVLDRQRPRLVRTLRTLSGLSRVVVPLIRRSKADSVASLEHLAPVLSQLTEVGHELALTLERAASYPMPSNTLAALKGDYLGVYVTMSLDVDSLNSLLGDAALPPSSPTTTDPGSPAQTPALPTPPTIPGAGEISNPGDLSDLLTQVLGGAS